eukprot:TRINITY_DN137_c0_g1_i13.p10 TRINITY_DN137_c0_g1~~TRINITY_DN137_c0_g1_i13.p10  ORF type:complete len:146 (-),score=10.33 TRINITY_DN137_c0_g1_i13:3531-3968(-)
MCIRDSINAEYMGIYNFIYLEVGLSELTLSRNNIMDYLKDEGELDDLVKKNLILLEVLDFIKEHQVILNELEGYIYMYYFDKLFEKKTEEAEALKKLVNLIDLQVFKDRPATLKALSYYFSYWVLQAFLQKDFVKNNIFIDGGSF